MRSSTSALYECPTCGFRAEVRVKTVGQFGRDFGRGFKAGLKAPVIDGDVQVAVERPGDGALRRLAILPVRCRSCGLTGSKRIARGVLAAGALLSVSGAVWAFQWQFDTALSQLAGFILYAATVVGSVRLMIRLAGGDLRFVKRLPHAIPRATLRAAP